MDWKTVESIPVNIKNSGFWTAVNVWSQIPHVLNRRICGVEILYHENIQNDLDGTKLKVAIDEAKSTYLLANISNDDEVLRVLKTAGLSFPYCDEDILSDIDIILKVILPKNNEHYKPCLEIEILEREVDVATYVALFYSEDEPVLTPHIPYRVALLENGAVNGGPSIELSVCEMQTIKGQEKSKSNLGIKKSIEWLQNNLLPKFCKWSATPSNASMGSLKLVPVNSYNTLYHTLKAKYAPNLIKLWPESTDPKKFIHEDLGIATYLILLWKQERKNFNSDKMQTFVDIGCGNGLLVYILTEEGHPGLGVDIRSRQIWSLYPPTTKLKVCTINPLEEIPFPTADWLIGNHSDELTPWIPVISSMKPHSRFFVLPCCPYDFYGRYARRNPKRSIYQEYLEYIEKDVCERICKFTCQLDRLRIPSTKRICIVGRRKVNENIKGLTESLTPSTYLTNNLGYKASNIKDITGKHNSFIPRPATEKVRNCTRLGDAVISEVVSLVAAELLSGFKEEVKYKGQWRIGKKVSLEALAKVIPSHLLLKLKNESGGLQTLLRNNHYVFKVTGGIVEFRKPVARDNPQKNIITQKHNLKGKKIKNHWKLRPCWFYSNHPDGCPLSDSQCSYIHAS